jgi:rRNA-processing protein FCF1
MQVILDSSFIISCVRDRIDFLNQLEEQGFTPVVPREVFQEMKDLRLSSRSSREDRIAIDVALEMLEKKKVKKTTLGEGKVDEFLIKKGQEGIFIATLDNGIKKKIPKKIVIFKAQNRVGVEEGA